jgi:hypothetical protein
MRKGGAYKHVHLVDASGVRLELPFLELGEELWDPEARRLTLLIDPGRIKRGVKPREELGPVLVEGGKYRLSIDQDWPDSAGNPLRAAFQKEFTVGPPDNVPPDPKTWVVVAPRPGTREALAIRFPEPLDRAMLEWALSVRGSDTTGVSGRNDVSDDARSWRFVPDREWTEGEYEVHVDRTLEDLAGNSIERPFEVDSERVIERRISATTTVLRVQILAGERREPR